MIKQHPIQILEHGKALCGKTFSRFVECWNWLFSFFVAMRGDADLDPQNGHIMRDDSGAFPVFRLVNANFGGKSSNPEGRQCYDICYEEDPLAPSVHKGDLVNCFIFQGGVCMTGPSANVFSYSNKIIAIKHDSTSANCSIKGYVDMSELLEEQEYGNVAIIPLYQMGECSQADETIEVLVDYRRMPHLDTWTYYH